MFPNNFAPGLTVTLPTASLPFLSLPLNPPPRTLSGVNAGGWRSAEMGWGEQEGKGKWSISEQKIYISFLEENLQEMGCRTLRKTEKVFMHMARQVRTRTADQCRSHHQKILKYHNSLQDIIDYYKEHLFGKQVQGDSCIFRKTGDEEPLGWYRIYRRGNRFRVEIDAQSVGEYYQ